MDNIWTLGQDYCLSGSISLLTSSCHNNRSNNPPAIIWVEEIDEDNLFGQRNPTLDLSLLLGIYQTCEAWMLVFSFNISFSFF